MVDKTGPMLLFLCVKSTLTYFLKIPLTYLLIYMMFCKFLFSPPVPSRFWTLKPISAQNSSLTSRCSIFRSGWKKMKDPKSPEPGISGLEKTAPPGELEFFSRLI